MKVNPKKLAMKTVNSNTVTDVMSTKRGVFKLHAITLRYPRSTITMGFSEKFFLFLLIFRGFSKTRSKKGITIKATIKEAVKAKINVAATSLMINPTMPGKNVIGMNTTIVVNVDAS